MKKFEGGFTPPAPEVKKLEKLTREEVNNKIKKKENLEGFDLQGIHLVGLNLEKMSFRGSDVRGIVLYYPEEGGETEVKTNIRKTDWTDATFADTGMTYFNKVDAEEATFGYTENLISRRERHQENHQKTGKAPGAEDTGGLYGFNGNGGNFKKTRWNNCDFGGGSGYEATFPGADLSESAMEGCDLSGVDFSKTKIENIIIKDPVSLRGLKINEQQIEFIAQSIKLSDQKAQAKFSEEISSKGPREALISYFGIII